MGSFSLSTAGRLPRIAGAAAVLVLVVMAVFAASRCAPDEAAGRAAFAAYMRDKVMPSSGWSLPDADSALRASFGPYAEHYAVLRDFQVGLRNAGSRNAATVLALAEKKDLAAYAQSRSDLRTAARDAERLGEDVAKLLERADKRRAALHMPDELRAPYAEAFRKTVTIPGEAAQTTFAAVRGWYASLHDLVAFIDKNSRDVAIEGGRINLKNPGLMDALTERLRDLEAREASLRDAVRAMAGG